MPRINEPLTLMAKVPQGKPCTHGRALNQLLSHQRTHVPNPPPMKSRNIFTCGSSDGLSYRLARTVCQTTNQLFLSPAHQARLIGVGQVAVMRQHAHGETVLAARTAGNGAVEFPDVVVLGLAVMAHGHNL